LNDGYGVCERKDGASAGAFTEILESHEPLRRRRVESERRRTQARELIQSAGFFKDAHLTLFVAGSMGRGEMGDRSDLDLFMLTTRHCSQAEQTELIGCMDELNATLGYLPFSNRRFLKAYDLDALLRNTGSPEDDSENCFTSRLLLLLESLPLANDETYRQIRDQVLGQYFRDERGKSSYRPLFLLNDVLRYWRTLCLNYEVLRHDPGRPWW
jgi:predicted nucleotidyltransferase